MDKILRNHESVLLWIAAAMLIIPSYSTMPRLTVVLEVAGALMALYGIILWQGENDD